MTLRPAQLETLRVVDSFDRLGDGCMSEHVSVCLDVPREAAAKRLERLEASGLIERCKPVWVMARRFRLTDHGRRILREQEGRDG